LKENAGAHSFNFGNAKNGAARAQAAAEQKNKQDNGNKRKYTSS
jgi:hypothetical protein